MLQRLLAAAVLLALGLLPALATAAEGCTRQAGRVTLLGGRVEVASGGDGPFQGLAAGAPLCVGDLLRASDSDASVRLETGAILLVKRGSTLRIQEIGPGRPTLIRLLEGIVSIFTRRAEALSVDTPFANAAVEGTEFTVEAGRDRARVSVLEGRVRVSNPLGSLRLAQGEVAVAPAGQAPELELRVRPRDAVQWALHYPPVAIGAHDGPPALREAGALATAGKRAEALARLDAAPARDPAFHAARAELLLALRRVEEAEADLAAALAQAPGNAEALALRAVIGVARNEREQALADAQAAVAADPRSVRARIALSYAAQSRFDLDLARSSLEAAVAAEPENALAWARLAELALMRGDTGAAGRASRRALAIAPGAARVELVGGFVELARLDTRRARAAFARALAADPFNPLAHLGLGLAQVRERGPAAGREEIELAATLDPGNALIRSQLGRLYVEAGENRFAGEELATAQALDPNDQTPWFYEALRQDRANRPIEALQELDAAIARNDNRAVSRAPLLLERDRASRGVNLARIYDRLGFERLGQVTALRALAGDPASQSAHRFLAETYAARPRREIAQVSELLQAQLLDPLNTAPLQTGAILPEIGVTNRTGSTLAGFEDYAPLFDREGLRLDAAGTLSSDPAYEEELILTGLYRQGVLSVGQSHSEFDGFRRNNDHNRDVVDLFGQIALDPRASVQVEYGRLEREYGDLAQRLTGSFDPDTRTDIDQSVLRLGGRLEFWPGAVLLGSLITTDRDDGVRSSAEDGALRVGDDSVQAELQQHLSLGPVRLILGGKNFESDRAQEENFVPKIETEAELRSAYAYLLAPLGAHAQLTLGLESLHYEDEVYDYSSDELNWKLGLAVEPLQGLTLRGAAFTTRKPRIGSNRTLEPTQVAGFNQFFDDTNSSRAVTYGLGADWRVSERLWLGLEGTRREITRLVSLQSFDPATGPVLVNAKGGDIEHNLYGYGHLVLSPRLAASLGIELDRWRTNLASAGRPEELDTLHVPLQLSYFAPQGWFATGRVHGVAQDEDRSDSNDHDEFVTFDAGIGYQIQGGRAGIAFEVDNILGSDFHYEDDNFRSTNQVASSLMSDRTFIVRGRVQF